MKLRDVLENEEKVLHNIIHYLKRVKQSLMVYTRLSKKEFDSQLDDMIKVFGDGKLEEWRDFQLDIDGENKLYKMISTIDSWILSLHRVHKDKMSQKKGWFSDDDLEKDTIYRVKDDDGENTDGGK